LQDDARINAEEVHQSEQDQDAKDPDASALPRTPAGKADATAREGKAEAPAFVPPIFDVLALSFAAPPHL